MGLFQHTEDGLSNSKARRRPRSDKLVVPKEQPKLTVPALGRPWNVEELRHKSWEDLHALWWICCKERNRIATQQKERWKLGGENGNRKAKKRDRYVCGTTEFRCMSSR